MSRLLFAAARGARIQREVELLKGKCVWHDCKVQWGMDDELRIHPEDAHLQYGPISTALREMAETGKEPYTLSGLMAMAAFKHEREYPFVLMAEWPHAQMFLLILSEALADEGL